MLATTKPPGPKISWLAYAALYRDPLGYLASAARKYGDIVHLAIAHRHDFLLNHPDYIRTILLDYEGMRRSVHRPLQRILGRGLLTSRGQVHKKQRLLLQPIFNRERIAALGELMTPRIARLSDEWRDGAQVEMANEMKRLTIATAGRTLLNVDLESEATGLRDALMTVLTATRFNNLLVATKALEALPLPSNLRFRRAAKRLDEFIYQMIAERHCRPTDQPDLLSVLVRLSSESRKGMTDQKVRDQILTFFVAGHETTATALTWVWYLLAQHPAVMDKVQAELDGVLADRQLSVSDLERLPYTRMVFAEAMRLYPPVWIIGRHALRDCPMNGFVIPKGSYVHVSQFLMHRDPRYYADPERFEPERWTAEGIAARPKFSYFPFGAGGLQCIGESFAWTQALLVIGMLASRWRMRVVPGHKIELLPEITLGSRYGMPMILERRKCPGPKQKPVAA
jgi:cytochrome P450